MTDHRRSRRHGRVLTEDEAKLFRHVMRGVELKAGEPAEPYTGPRSEQRPPPVHVRAPAPLPEPKRVRSLDAISSGQTDGIDRRTAERFTKGRMPIEATLDLHGLTQDQAHRALTAFIHRARAKGLRCVLVITGKGARGRADSRHDHGVSGGKGILKSALPGWLNGQGVREHILSFSQARPRDGGGGAFYVLLKRVRGTT